MSDRRPTRVFVLDDAPSIRDTASALLEDAGFAVTATDAWAEVSAGIFAIKDGGAIVLVADLDMPGIKGEDFCASVKRYRPDVRVIIFSGSAEQGRAAASRLGVPFALKGDGPETLVVAVRAAVASHHAASTRSEPGP